MKFSQLTSTSFALVSLSTLSQAWPLLRLAKRNPEPLPLPLPAPEPQSYSVVPVDGGSLNGPPATTTILSAVTQTQIQTVVTTVTEGDSAFATTILAPTTVVVTIVDAVATKTLVVEPSVTSVPFDDGQWHTTYFFRSTLSDVFVPAASAEPSASSATDVPAATSPASTITSCTEVAAETASTTDWATYYGTWRETPEDGSWWGKGDS